MFKSIQINCVAVLILSACSVSTGDPALVDALASARIDSTLGSFVETGKVAGISALIYEKQKEVSYNAFGFADREANVPMSRRPSGTRETSTRLVD